MEQLPRKSRQIPVVPLQQILEEYCANQFPDLLNIDTEGMDLELLQQIDYTKSTPKIIIVETVIFGSVRKDLRIKTFLESKGYTAPYETPINTIFVRKDCWKQML
ncbi:MAG: FkbM family methyltransferase [Lachnospiraceae bacterium]|nr:FkbM family methyltransferase [Lachnospiraceae bacterium]